MLTPNLKQLRNVLAGPSDSSGIMTFNLTLTQDGHHGHHAIRFAAEGVRSTQVQHVFVHREGGHEPLEAAPPMMRHADLKPRRRAGGTVAAAGPLAHGAEGGRAAASW